MIKHDNTIQYLFYPVWITVFHKAATQNPQIHHGLPHQNSPKFLARIASPAIQCCCYWTLKDRTSRKLPWPWKGEIRKCVFLIWKLMISEWIFGYFKNLRVLHCQTQNDMAKLPLEGRNLFRILLGWIPASLVISKSYFWGGIMFFCFGIFAWISVSLLLYFLAFSALFHFFASLLVCFSKISAFSASLCFLLFCFSLLLFFLAFCFSLLLCFFASLLFCFFAVLLSLLFLPLKPKQSLQVW